MNEKTTYILAGLVSVLVIVVIFQSYQLSRVNDSTPTGNAVAFSIDDVPSGDLFDGKITNVDVQPGKVIGTGVYDRNCKSIGNGETNCEAGIKTEEYGVLNFNYEHNMRIKPCIAPGQPVLVEILDSEGNVKVQRFY